MGSESYRHKSLHPGELFVSEEPHKMRTILGSCVSVTVFDSRKKFGGMNHFMLPESGPGDSPDGNKYGKSSTRRLIEAMIDRGSSRRDLVVKLFGGSRVVEALAETDIGRKNLKVARRVISSYDLRVAREQTRVSKGLKLIFDNRTNKVLVRKLTQSNGSRRKLRQNEAKVSSILSGENGLDLLEDRE